MTNVLLAVEELAVDVEGQEILNDVCWDLRRGEVLGIVGETGSGKTMCLRAITGMLPRIGGRITRGRIQFDGNRLEAAGERDWQALRGHRIALVPQSSLGALDPLMRIDRQLGETIRALGQKDGVAERSIDLLRQVELPDTRRILRSYPHELSGGMRQRVMIALALAGRPDVLVADEPTTALDVTVQRSILELFLRLKDEGLSMILVTHDLGIAETVSDTIAVMYAGATVERGTTEVVLANPAHDYTRALLGARPALHDEQGARSR
jgi:ABC-type glutathione transport system ATPase component